MTAPLVDVIEGDAGTTPPVSGPCPTVTPSTEGKTDIITGKAPTAPPVSGPSPTVSGGGAVAIAYDVTATLKWLSTFSFVPPNEPASCDLNLTGTVAEICLGLAFSGLTGFIEAKDSLGNDWPFDVTMTAAPIDGHFPSGVGLGSDFNRFIVGTPSVGLSVGDEGCALFKGTDSEG